MELGVIFYVAIIIMSVVIHEVSHGYMAYALGDPTAKMAGRLTLNPIPHIDLFGSILVPAFLSFLGGPIIGWAKPVPFNPYNLRGRFGPGWVALAGPLSNILVAVVFGLLIRFGLSYGFVSSEFAGIAGLIVSLNVLLAIFNLMPVPPLDGSHILLAFLPYRWQRIGDLFERFGLFLILALVLFGAKYILALQEIVVRFLISP